MKKEQQEPQICFGQKEDTCSQTIAAQDQEKNFQNQKDEREKQQQQIQPENQIEKQTLQDIQQSKIQQQFIEQQLKQENQEEMPRNEIENGDKQIHQINLEENSQSNKKQQPKEQHQLKEEAKQETKQELPQIENKTLPKPMIPKTHVRITFEFQDEDNMPLQPFLSLLCLMPPTSKDLLPKRFHSAYDQQSCIKDLLPQTVEIDLNGRSLPWQAISLVPFIDVKRVTDCYKALFVKSNEQNLTPSELQRNIFHVQTVFKYQQKLQGHHTITSEIKGFPDIPHQKNKVFEYHKNGDPVLNNEPLFFKPVKMDSFKAQLYTIKDKKLHETMNIKPCIDYLSIN